MSQLVSISDFEHAAQQQLSVAKWLFLSGGAMDEQTSKDNCVAFKRYRLRPRILVDVSNVDLSTTVLGSKIPFPICVAPTGANKVFNESTDLGGSVAIAKAAKSLGTGFTMSTWSTCSMDDIVQAAPSVTKWFQVYLFKNRQLVARLVKRAEASGFKAIFVTVDYQVQGLRYSEIRAGFTVSPALQVGLYGEVHNSSYGGDDLRRSVRDPSVNWSDFEWLKSLTKLPIVIKGILTGEMACEAVNHGVDGIVVSNHGGRQLDGVPATIDVLSEVVKAVNGRCEVYLDGGIRNGNDALKAIALGARAVFVGRPVLWGLICEGDKGVQRVLEILRDELMIAMQLMVKSGMSVLA